MKREIIFRGQRVDNKEWVYGFYYNIQEIEHFILEPVVLGLLHTQVIPETVGQFTGLTDKNGNKIFEGDLVVSNFNIRKYECVFNIFGFQFKNIETDSICLHFDIWEMELIGNIHEP